MRSADLIKQEKETVRQSLMQALKDLSLIHI